MGGLGIGASGALASVAEPVRDGMDSWKITVRDAARDADDYVHSNPWAALAVVGLVGLAAGYLLSRRTLP